MSVDAGGGGGLFYCLVVFGQNHLGGQVTSEVETHSLIEMLTYRWLRFCCPLSWFCVSVLGFPYFIIRCKFAFARAMERSRCNFYGAA